MRALLIPSLKLLCLAIALPATANAQACLGRSVPENDRAVLLQAGSFRYEFDDEVRGTDLGAMYWANPAGFLAYSVGYVYRNPESGAANLNMGSASLDLQIPLRRFVPYAPHTCISGEARVASLSSSESAEYTSYAFPVGLAIGVPVSLGGKTEVVPFVYPQYIFTRGDGEVLGFPVEDEFDRFGVQTGVGVGRGLFTGRLTVQFEDRPSEAGPTPVADWQFGVDLGIRF